MALSWTKSNGSSLGIIEENKTLQISLPIVSDNLAETTVSLISGSLPPGLRINGLNIIGTPSEVARVTEFTFVLRATYNGIADRTFSITVFGEDAPDWITPEGDLPVGNNNSFYILDSSPVEFQLQAEDDDTAAGQTLEYFIASGDGQLPPGIQLTRDGRIVGVVDPVLALDKLAAQGFYDDNAYGEYPFDFGVRPANGYDSFYYDIAFYDLSIPTKSPKKLNRNYEFIVSVSDGDTIEKRKFKIFVVGDDFLRADNTLMQVGNATFSADNTHVRTPIWLTPGDLGYRRANNYVTLFLEVLDANTLSGFLGYTLEPVNDDGSPSILPPGMELDGRTGEVAGRVPYQPDITREYKFTVKAIRFAGVDNRQTVSFFMQQAAQAGSSELRILPTSYTLDLIGTTLNIEGSVFKITSAEIDRSDYHVLRLNRETEILLRTGLELFSTIKTGETTNIAEKAKTFTVRLLGEVDSRITWLSPKELGTINANLTSTFRVEAETSVPSAVLRYTLSSGVLPPGLNLSLDGEIFGKVQQFGENYYRSFWKAGVEYNTNDVIDYNGTRYKSVAPHTSSLAFSTDASFWEPYEFARSGLTTIDSDNLQLDGGNTSIDKTYRFRVNVEDQFGFSAIQKDFVINVNDPNDLLYSNLIVKPFLKQAQRDYYNAFVSDPTIFNPRYIYRPNDTEFGIQRDVKMLVYAGIETKNIREYVAASAKNHKKKTFRFGQIKKALAKQPGTQNIVYEIIYVDVLDPADSRTDSKVRSSFKIKTPNKRTIDETDYNVNDDTSNSIDSESFRFRPITNPVKISSNAIKISEKDENRKYISNITNMRSQIATVGDTDGNFLPLWMRTPQENAIEELGFVNAVPLCYCKPGTADEILLNIKNSNFDFTTIDFTIDRYIIDSSEGKSEEQYILFANYDFNV
jgi:hypothetical protein